MTEEQSVAVCDLRQQLLDCTGHALVMGGPGSGKTTIALKKAVVRIGDGLAPGQSVLFLSFSRAAVARVGEAIRQEAPKAQRGMLSMQTFHSFFWMLLSAHAYLLGAPKSLRILLPQDEQARYGTIKAKDRNHENPAWLVWLAERERLFREDGQIAFDLFAPNAAQLLQRSELVRRLVSQRHPLIIVDEAQDTNEDAWRCIELLAPTAQVICLADLEQQIFDHLPGIGPERITAIKKSLNPLELDLGAQNHRSGSTEIAIFGQDILLGNVRGSPYTGVSAFTYNPKLRTQNAIMRMSLGMLQRAIKKATGNYGKSVAILTHSGASAAKVSSALNAESKPVRHKLSFDEAEAMLTARFAAFLLEPKHEHDRMQDLATALELLATAKRANGLAAAKQWQVWALAARAGKVSKAKFVQSVLAIMDELRGEAFSGDPGRDWTHIKGALRAVGDADLTDVAKSLDYLVAFNRGKRISGGLGAVWMRDGQYTRAREVLDIALAQDQILGGIDDPLGVQVMTIHKAKGKQFDGVIVVREGRHDGQEMASSFVWWGDEPPYHRSRKILRVAITRAKAHALVLGPIYPACPIVGPHKL
ncbi:MULTISPECIES: UvrD-helicase domain-containing protein [Paraburkholderia]|uniref:UvrD-helicase domain-containing protein n=1 Tax=Paraburkholderia TaxID=1822464 RepID=UPI001EF8F2A1|nr:MULTISPECIES: UvrD-helicase domain-containing protein [Paraburkholderia]MDH6152624.1 DNA helicase-2/ATP-dependent DNA helicase PcrA [Paraburkholderia sp. WSM4179]